MFPPLVSSNIQNRYGQVIYEQRLQILGFTWRGPLLQQTVHENRILRNTKAPGFEFISYEMIRHVHPISSSFFQQHISTLFQRMDETLTNDHHLNSLSCSTSSEGIMTVFCHILSFSYQSRPICCSFDSFDKPCIWSEFPVWK